MCSLSHDSQTFVWQSPNKSWTKRANIWLFQGCRPWCPPPLLPWPPSAASTPRSQPPRSDHKNLLQYFCSQLPLGYIWLHLPASASVCHLATLVSLACGALALVGFTFGLSGRFYCQLCYILIKSSLSTISLCQIGFLISANVRIKKILQANYTLYHFFLQSPQSCPKSIKLVIMRKPIFLRPECIVLRIKLQKIYWFSP